MKDNSKIKHLTEQLCAHSKEIQKKDICDSYVHEKSKNEEYLFD